MGRPAMSVIERRAKAMPTEMLRRELRNLASFIHNDYMRPEDLRELATLALVLARRLEP